MADRRFKVLVCRGPTCGGQCNSAALRKVLDAALAEAGIAEDIEVGWQSCFGRCSQAPNMLVRDMRATAATSALPRTVGLAAMPARKGGRAALYSRLDPDRMVTIVREHLIHGRVVRRLLSVRPTSSTPADSTRPRTHRLPQVLAATRGISEGEK